MPPSGVPQDVPDGIEALLAQHFYEAGNALSLCLFYGLKVSWPRLAPQRLGGSQVVVQGQLEVIVPARLKASTATRRPTGYKPSTLSWRSDYLGYPQQRFVDGNQDRAGQNVLHQERVESEDDSLIAASPYALLTTSVRVRFEA
jgi:hypothetical protein